jgi:predicted nucleic acid-binding Zn ribbon protein
MIQRAQRIQDVLQRVIGQLGLARRLHETDAVAKFAEIVGESLADKAEAVSIENGRLVVRVPSPTWRQELSYRREEIAKALNETLGEEVVREVFFVS